MQFNSFKHAHNINTGMGNGNGNSISNRNINVPKFWYFIPIVFSNIISHLNSFTFEQTPCGDASKKSDACSKYVLVLGITIETIFCNRNINIPKLWYFLLDIFSYLFLYLNSLPKQISCDVVLNYLGNMNIGIGECNRNNICNRNTNIYSNIYIYIYTPG